MVEFSVAFDSLEDRDTSAKPEFAKAIAEASGGRYFATRTSADPIAATRP